MRLRWLALFAVVAACGPDPEPRPCTGADFEVLISVPYMPLPSDIVIRLHYGSRAFDDPEELVVADPQPPQALFCYRADRNGVKLDLTPLGNDGAGGAGGASASDAPFEALLCELWTDGSADLDVVTQGYGITSVKLQSKKRVCSIKSVLELSLADAGT
jgi:hypothetical protein